MKKTTANKWHLFIVLFFISLAMRVQVPVFTPYAAAFGATSVFIGIILSVTSLTNLSGNVLAGPLIDRLGKKLFITLPIFASGLLFIAHAFANDPGDLLVLHGLNGFALAFLIPAAFAMLSGFAENSRQQGKNMAINGLFSTIAGIAAPLIGGKLVVIIGYQNTYWIIGSTMLAVGLYAVRSLNETKPVVSLSPSNATIKFETNPKLIAVYLIGFAAMYVHGVVIYEVPYLAVENGLSTFDTGRLFSYMGIGTLMMLSMFFVNRFSPFKRLVTGLFGIAMALAGIFTSVLPLAVLLFFLGIFSGLVMPAMATAVTDNTSKQSHGRAFGFMSAIYSLGIISSSFFTGVIRDSISPYFIAFLVSMTVLTIAGYTRLRSSNGNLQHI